MYAQVADHAQCDGETSATVAAKSGKKCVKKRKGPLDKQDSCFASPGVVHRTVRCQRSSRRTGQRGLTAGFGRAAPMTLRRWSCIRQGVIGEPGAL